MVCIQRMKIYLVNYKGRKQRHSISPPNLLRVIMFVICKEVMKHNLHTFVLNI